MHQRFYTFLISPKNYVINIKYPLTEQIGKFTGLLKYLYNNIISIKNNIHKYKQLNFPNFNHEFIPYV